MVQHLSSLAIYENVKHRIITWPSNSSPKYPPRRNKPYIHAKTCTQMSLAVFTTTKKWKQPNVHQLISREANCSIVIKLNSFSCIGEGNGNPLQCSCLQNPREGGAWLAAVYGVAQSRTRLKRLSSSSSNCKKGMTYSDRRYNMDKPWKHYAQWIKTKVIKRAHVKGFNL